MLTRCVFPKAENSGCFFMIDPVFHILAVLVVATVA